MKNIFSIAILILALGIVSCETSEDISNELDHRVPDCKTLTLSANGQTEVIDDNIAPLLLWGVVPQTNLEVITLPTLTATKGSIVDISVVISDNVALKTAEISYPNWLFSKYINFTNPEGDIPLKPQSYTFTAQVTVPEDAVTAPWLENYYFNDGSSMKITQSYHKIVLTVTDINMNVRILPIFVKVE
ncbi:MAG TPA: hypothetical protein VFG54_22375 [Prolixibacteraceae bacterium]|nr:hypothetical protein [Prolixibacteraceae bacterium]